MYTKVKICFAVDALGFAWLIHEFQANKLLPHINDGVALFDSPSLYDEVSRGKSNIPSEPGTYTANVYVYDNSGWTSYGYEFNFISCLSDVQYCNDGSWIIN